MQSDRWPAYSQQRPYTWLLTILWLGLISWIAFWHGLGSIGLLDETEPMFVEAARQMFETGDWITPYFNGLERFDKPPLVYWLMAISFHLFGVSEGSARIAVALPGTIVVSLIFYTLNWVRRNLLRTPMPRYIPYLGAAIVGLNLQMCFFGHIVYADMLLNACFTGALLAFFRGYCQVETPLRQRLWYVLSFASLGLGVLTKGPVALVLPGAIVLIFLVCTGNLKSVLQQELPWKFGILLLSLIALPWYGLIIARHGSSFIDAFFGFHNVQRFAVVVNQHGGAWYYHWLILLPGLLPWSIGLPAAVVAACRRPIIARERPEHLGLLALIWFGVVMIFFTIAATKYLTYSLPAVPAAAILLTLWWNDFAPKNDLTPAGPQRQRHRAVGFNPATQSRPETKSRMDLGLKLSNYFTLASFALLAISSWYAPHWLNDDTCMPELGRMVAAAGLNWIGAVIWGLGLLLGLLYVHQTTFWRVNIMTAAAFLLLFAMPVLGVLDQARQLPLRQVAIAINILAQPNEPVAMGTRFFGKPSLIFYSQRPLALMRRSSELNAYLAAARSRSQTDPQAPHSVLLVTTSATLMEAAIPPTDYALLQPVGIYQLVRIRF
jgi:4-amino-4-deoxy-L-arabinose transferase-like glycosyltransferase